jgi:hypothetical protein
MARYVLPRIDTQVTCFTAEKGTVFDTAPSYWRRFATKVREVSTPGTHHTILMSERQALANALGQALQQAKASYVLRHGQKRRAANTVAAVQDPVAE